MNATAAAVRANDGLHEHVAAKLERLLPDRTQRVLDVGCGTGAFLLRLAERGYRHLTGIDIAPPDGSPGAIRFLQGDLDATWPCDSAAFDLVVSIEVVEHVENPGSMLREMARVLEPGGVALLTTPNLHSLEARLRWLLLGQLKQFDALGDPTHISPVFLFPFERLARRHGFELAQSWGHPSDGASPTSRPGLRRLSSVLRALGLRGAPAGDQLCMTLRKTAHAPELTSAEKRRQLTAHYERTPSEPGNPA